MFALLLEVPFSTRFVHHGSPRPRCRATAVELRRARVQEAKKGYPSYQVPPIMAIDLVARLSDLVVLNRVFRYATAHVRPAPSRQRHLQ